MRQICQHRLFHRFTVILLACGIVFPAVQAVAQSRAEEWQTVAVFSMISTDEGAPLIRQAVTAMNHPGLADMLADMEKTQREAFVTLDFSQPKGVVCQTNGRSFRFLAFAAMRDVTALPYGIGKMIADCEVNRDGWYKMPLSNAGQLPIMYQNVYVKQQGNWAYACYGVTQPPKELPDDAAILLEGLPQEYPVALRFNCAVLPKSLVNGYAALAKTFLPMAKAFLQMPQMEDSESQMALASFDLFTAVAKETIDQLVKFVNETETITFGLSGNADNDLIMTAKLIAKPGTDMAGDLALMADCTTGLIGFYRPDEAIYSQITATPIQAYDQAYCTTILTATEKLIDDMTDNVRKGLERDNNLTDFDGLEGMEKVMSLVKQSVHVLQQTVGAGKFDFAESITADFTTLMAVKIAGGNVLLKPGNELYDFAHLMMAQQLADDGIAQMVILERETYKDFLFWTIDVSISLPRHYVFGLSDSMFVYAQGFAPSVLDTVKEAIDRSSKPVPVPKEIMVFAPDKIGHAMKTFGLDIIANGIDEGQAVMDIMNTIPENAKIVVTQEVGDNTLTWTTVFDGKLWPTVGAILEAQSANRKAQR